MADRYRIERLARVLNEVRKHYGPGDHPSGSPQTLHGGNQFSATGDPTSRLNRYLERASAKLDEMGWQGPDKPEMRRGVALHALKLADFDHSRAEDIIGDFIGVFSDLDEFQDKTDRRWSPEHFIALNVEGHAAVFHARPDEKVHPSLEWSTNPSDDEPDDEREPSDAEIAAYEERRRGEPMEEADIRRHEAAYERSLERMWP
jgi:hypothetical protein